MNIKTTTTMPKTNRDAVRRAEEAERLEAEERRTRHEAELARNLEADLEAQRVKAVIIRKDELAAAERRRLKAEAWSQRVATKRAAIREAERARGRR